MTAGVSRAAVDPPITRLMDGALPIRLDLADALAALGAIVAAHDDVFFAGEVFADGTYRELFTGPGSERVLGGPVPPGKAFEEVWAEHVHPDDRVVYAEMNQTAERGEHAEREYRLVGFDGVVRWVHDRLRPRPATGDGRRIVDGVISDVTARRAQEAALAEAIETAEQRARTDALTGLFNRRHFHEAAAAELVRSDREGSAIGLVLLDVDRFKAVNDRYGHDVGDQVLVAVSELLGRSVRQYDIVARWGGEEFVVLLPGIADDPSLVNVATEITDALRATPIETTAGPLPVTISAGAIRRLPYGDGLDVALDAADRALYAAKRRGRDRVVLAGEVTARDAIDEEPEAVRLAEGLAIAASIREAIPPLHCRQVADLAAAIAGALALTPAEVLRCRLGGWLHDVGKLAMSDTVLQAAAQRELDDEQRALLRRHAEVGAAVVSALPSLSDVAPAIRHHHERFDGGGYPSGLAGDGIPLEARIVAVADAYSALTAGRAYQRPLDHDDAMLTLVAAGGASVDPQIVEALARVFSGRALDDVA